MIKIIDRIILIGSSHIAENSVKEIEEAIDKFTPSVVALELDTQRFKRLMSENKEVQKGNNIRAIKELGMFGYLFAQVAGFVQKKVGSKVDMEPGIDMKSAYLKAKDRNIPAALIDIDIRITMKKMSSLSFGKKIKLASSIFFKSFKKEYKELLNFDLKSVPSDEVVIQMIEILKKETPDLYKILIDDRNKYMAKRLEKLMENHDGYILAVVGAGHVKGMSEILEKKKTIQNKDNGISFSFYAEHTPDTTF